MNSTIRDLWYGNIRELDACGSTPALLHKEAYIEIKRKDLAQSLTTEQQKQLDALITAMHEITADHAAAAFERGFCLAARLMAEAWTCQIP